MEFGSMPYESQQELRSRKSGRVETAAIESRTLNAAWMGAQSPIPTGSRHRPAGRAQEAFAAEGLPASHATARRSATSLPDMLENMVSRIAMRVLGGLFERYRLAVNAFEDAQQVYGSTAAWDAKLADLVELFDRYQGLLPDDMRLQVNSGIDKLRQAFVYVELANSIRLDLQDIRQLKDATVADWLGILTGLARTCRACMPEQMCAELDSLVAVLNRQLSYHDAAKQIFAGMQEIDGQRGDGATLSRINQLVSEHAALLPPSLVLTVSDLGEAEKYYQQIHDAYVDARRLMARPFSFQDLISAMVPGAGMAEGLQLLDRIEDDCRAARNADIVIRSAFDAGGGLLASLDRILASLQGVPDEGFVPAWVAGSINAGESALRAAIGYLDKAQDAYSTFSTLGTGDMSLVRKLTEVSRLLTRREGLLPQGLRGSVSALVDALAAVATSLQVGASFNEDSTWQDATATALDRLAELAGNPLIEACLGNWQDAVRSCQLLVRQYRTLDRLPEDASFERYLQVLLEEDGVASWLPGQLRPALALATEFSRVLSERRDPSMPALPDTSAGMLGWLRQVLADPGIRHKAIALLPEDYRKPLEASLTLYDQVRLFPAQGNAIEQARWVEQLIRRPEVRELLDTSGLQPAIDRMSEEFGLGDSSTMFNAFAQLMLRKDQSVAARITAFLMPWFNRTNLLDAAKCGVRAGALDIACGPQIGAAVSPVVLQGLDWYQQAEPQATWAATLDRMVQVARKDIQDNPARLAQLLSGSEAEVPLALATIQRFPVGFEVHDVWAWAVQGLKHYPQLRPYYQQFMMACVQWSLYRASVSKDPSEQRDLLQKVQTQLRELSDWPGVNALTYLVPLIPDLLRIPNELASQMPETKSWLEWAQALTTILASSDSRALQGVRGKLESFVEDWVAEVLQQGMESVLGSWLTQQVTTPPDMGEKPEGADGGSRALNTAWASDVDLREQLPDEQGIYTRYTASAEEQFIRQEGHAYRVRWDSSQETWRLMKEGAGSMLLALAVVRESGHWRIRLLSRGPKGGAPVTPGTIATAPSPSLDDWSGSLETEWPRDFIIQLTQAELRSLGCGPDWRIPLGVGVTTALAICWLASLELFWRMRRPGAAQETGAPASENAAAPQPRPEVIELVPVHRPGSEIVAELAAREAARYATRQAKVAVPLAASAVAAAQANAETDRLLQPEVPPPAIRRDVLQAPAHALSAADPANVAAAAERRSSARPAVGQRFKAGLKQYGGTAIMAAVGGGAAAALTYAMRRPQQAGALSEHELDALQTAMDQAESPIIVTNVPLERDDGDDVAAGLQDGYSGFEYGLSAPQRDRRAAGDASPAKKPALHPHGFAPMPRKTTASKELTATVMHNLDNGSVPAYWPRAGEFDEQDAYGLYTDAGGVKYIYIADYYWLLADRTEDSGSKTAHGIIDLGQGKVTIRYHPNAQAWFSFSQENGSSYPTTTSRDSLVTEDLAREAKDVLGPGPAYTYPNSAAGREGAIYVERDKSLYLFLNGLYWPCQKIGSFVVAYGKGNVYAVRDADSFKLRPATTTTPIRLPRTSALTASAGKQLAWLVKKAKVSSYTPLPGDFEAVEASTGFFKAKNGSTYVYVRGEYWPIEGNKGQGLIAGSQPVAHLQVPAPQVRGAETIYQTMVRYDDGWRFRNSWQDFTEADVPALPAATTASSPLIELAKNTFDPTRAYTYFEQVAGEEGRVYRGNGSDLYMYLADAYWPLAMESPHIAMLMGRTAKHDVMLELRNANGQWWIAHEQQANNSMWALSQLLDCLAHAGAVGADMTRLIRRMLNSDAAISYSKLLEAVFKALERWFQAYYDTPTDPHVKDILQLRAAVAFRLSELGVVLPSGTGTLEKGDADLLEWYRNALVAGPVDQALLSAVIDDKASGDPLAVYDGIIKTADRKIKEIDGQMEALKQQVIVEEHQFWDRRWENCTLTDIDFKNRDESVVRKVKWCVKQYCFLKQKRMMQEEVKASAGKMRDERKSEAPPDEVYGLYREGLQKGEASEAQFLARRGQVADIGRMTTEYEAAYVSARSQLDWEFIKALAAPAAPGELEAIDVARGYIERRRTLMREYMAVLGKLAGTKLEPLTGLEDYDRARAAYRYAAKLYDQFYGGEQPFVPVAGGASGQTLTSQDLAQAQSAERAGTLKQLIAMAVYWLDRRHVDAQQLAKEDIATVQSAYRAALARNPYKQSWFAATDYTSLQELKPSDFFASHSDYTAQFADYKKTGAGIEGFSRAVRLLAQASLTEDELETPVKQYFQVYDRTSDSWVFMIKLSSDYWLYLELSGSQEVCRRLDYLEMSRTARFWREVPHIGDGNCFEGIYETRSVPIPWGDERSSGHLTAEYDEVTQIWPDSKQPRRINSALGAFDSSLLPCLAYLMERLQISYADRQKTNLYNPGLWQTLAEQFIPFYKIAYYSIHDKDYVPDGADIAGAIMDGLAVMLAGVGTAAKVSTAITNASARASSLVKAGRAAGLGGRAMVNYLVRNMADIFKDVALQVVKSTALLLYDILEPLPFRQMGKGLVGGGKSLAKDVQVKSVLDTVPSAAEVVTGGALPAKYVKQVNDELIDIGDGLFATKAMPQANEVKYYLEQDDQYYAVRWDADYGTYRLMDPAVDSTVWWGPAVARSDGRWSLSVAPGGLRGGGGFRELWKRYKNSPIPADRIEGIGPRTATRLRKILLKSSVIAEDTLDVARQLLGSRAAEDVQKVDRTLEIFLGISTPARKDYFNRLVYRVSEYSRRLDYSKVYYKEVHSLADGTELRHTLMNSAIPADRDINSFQIAEVDDALANVDLFAFRWAIDGIGNDIPPEKHLNVIAEAEIHEWHHAIAHSSDDVRDDGIAAYASIIEKSAEVDLARLLRLTPDQKILNAENFSYALQLLKMAANRPVSYEDFISKYDSWLRAPNRAFEFDIFID
jgi:hypothetical protein